MILRTRTVTAAMAALVLAMAVPAAASAQYWQCVPIARVLSGIQIFGDAYTWWSQATGRYDTGESPVSGSVLVFKPQGKMRKGHVAVVSSVLTDRIIQVTHANWSQIDGHRGQIEQDVTVVDVSANGDWSQVKVWYDPVGGLGTTVYKTYGFIYQDQAAEDLARAAEVDGVTGIAPVQMAATATPTGDEIAAIVARAAARNTPAN